MNKEEQGHEWNRIFQEWSALLEKRRLNSEITKEDVESIIKRKPDDHAMDELRYRIMRNKKDE